MKQKNPNKKNGFIPQTTYDQITKLMPIVSVEALIIADDKMLFLRRKNEPAKGQWWFPGGRIRKDEALQETLSREIKEETGLKIVSARLIGVYSRIFPERHDVTIVYSCKCKPGKIILNEEHTEFKFFETPPSNLHQFLHEVINDSRKKLMKIN